MKKYFNSLYPAAGRLLLTGLFLLFIGAFAMTSCRSADNREVPSPPASSRVPHPEATTVATKQKMNMPPHSIVEYSAHGTPSRLKGEDLTGPVASGAVYQSALAKRDHGEMVFLWLEGYREFFKLTAPRKQLRIESVKTDQLGSTHVKMQQIAGAVPVWGKSIAIHFNGVNAIYLFQGDYLPAAILADIDPSRAMTASKASAKALAAVEGDAAQWQVQDTSLAVYAAGNQSPRLAYVVIVAKGFAQRFQYIVDAENGTILDKFNLIRTGV